MFIVRPDEIRKLLYGFVQSVHFTLNQLIEEKNELKMTIENWNRAEEVNNFHKMHSNRRYNSAVNLQVKLQVNYSPMELPLMEGQSMMEDNTFTHNEVRSNSEIKHNLDEYAEFYIRHISLHKRHDFS